MYLEILNNLYVLSIPEYIILFLECYHSTALMFLCVWRCILLSSKRLEEFYSYSIFKNFSVTDPCPVNVKYSSRNNWGPRTEPLKSR